MSTNDAAATIWQRPRTGLALPANEVQVWRATLDQRDCLEPLYLLLAPEEKARAARFCFQRDREHFIIAHGVMRSILSGYLNERPEDLRFGFGAYGKPYLASANGRDLRFNLSHSHGVALLAVTCGGEIGIDLERIRPEVIKQQIAERFFSPYEIAAFRQLPRGQKVDGFFNCWTRKEAYIKARGEGLSLPLDQFDVSLALGEPAALLQSRMTANETSRWTMIAIDPGPGFKAALVVERRDWQLRCWQWSLEQAGILSVSNPAAASAALTRELKPRSEFARTLRSAQSSSHTEYANPVDAPSPDKGSLPAHPLLHDLSHLFGGAGRSGGRVTPE